MRCTPSYKRSVTKRCPLNALGGSSDCRFLCFGKKTVPTYRKRFKTKGAPTTSFLGLWKSCRHGFAGSPHINWTQKLPVGEEVLRFTTLGRPAGEPRRWNV